MRVSAGFLVASLFVFNGRPSLALAPCPPSCHLSQGQPIYLADADVLLTTRCDSVPPSGKKAAERRCTTERLDLDGKVLAQLPVPHTMGGDLEFERQHLDGHTVVQLNWQTAWSKLDKPYSLNTLSSGQVLTMTLSGAKLSCAAPGRPTLGRDFGCVPASVHVFASSSLDKAPRRPVVLVGQCRPDAQNSQATREVLVTCAASEASK